jgi:basic amino acid/polyamine antiporter, APA family
VPEPCGCIQLVAAQRESARQRHLPFRKCRRIFGRVNYALFMSNQNHDSLLKRELGVWGATALGLGSIVGTGVFVSIGIAAGVAGPAVILALVIAAFVALCNGLSSAQLAAAHPVSGGTYEYGYEFLGPIAGFSAGWLFMIAKSASAATAALGFSGYLLHALGYTASTLYVPIALIVIAAVTALVLLGIRRSSNANMLIVGATFLALTLFVLFGIGHTAANAAVNLVPFFAPEEGATPLTALLHASALMFVAYTGYGRIATLSEEVRAPERTIPRAVIVTLGITLLLYVSVAVVGISAVGSQAFGDAAEADGAPLEIAARAFSPTIATVVSVGAVTAMLGVLLNLVLGLSRVLLAMGRRRDVPGLFARLDESGATPYGAVIAVGVIIAILAFTGDVRTTWSFSAFTVLLYYAITNVAALRLPEDKRRYPRWIPITGLIACIGLAAFIDPAIILLGLGLIAVGMLWYFVARRIRPSDASE